MEVVDAYEILGLTKGASPEEIRAAYLRLSRQVHADTGGTDGLFRQVKEAYDTLNERSTANSSDANGFDGYGYDTRPRSGENAPRTSWLERNPSLALLFAGIVTFDVGAQLASPTLVLLAWLSIVAAVAGLVGAKEVRLTSRHEVGLALLKRQVLAGAPKLGRTLLKVLLVAVTFVTIFVVLEHSSTRHRRR